MAADAVEALDLAPLAGGRTRLRLRVRPGGKKNAIVGEHGGALRVSVTAAAERGKANRAVIALLAETLELPLSGVEIATGETSPDKGAVVALEAGEVRRRLAARIRTE